MAYDQAVEDTLVRYFQGIVQQEDANAADLSLSSPAREAHGHIRDLAQAVVDALVPGAVAPAEAPPAEPAATTEPGAPAPGAGAV